MTEPTKVLVIDDETAICDLLTDALTEAGYAVQTMDCGLDAVARVRAWQPAVVLIDILLPRMTGFEVLRAIQRLPDGRKVYLMSAHTTMDEAMTRVLQADGFISKAGEFVAAVEAAVASVEPDGPVKRP